MIEDDQEAGKEYEEKTILMIAHRLKTVRNADRIFVVDKGNIAQCGTHTELMKQDAVFANNQEDAEGVSHREGKHIAKIICI